MSEVEKTGFTAAFVLHQRPFRNTSQLIDLITADYGRITLVARGSRRPKPGRRALLQPFMPVRVSWTRRGELGSLSDVEASGHAPALQGDALLAGFYINELLLRLTARGDANSEVYSCYSHCLAELAAGAHLASALRLFELRLLTALGYGLELEHDARSGEPIHPDRRYLFELERGPVEVDSAAHGDGLYWGRELIALREGRLGGSDMQRLARKLLSKVLHSYLGEQPLKSRTVLKDIYSRGLVE